MSGVPMQHQQSHLIKKEEKVKGIMKIPLTDSEKNNEARLDKDYYNFMNKWDYK